MANGLCSGTWGQPATAEEGGFGLENSDEMEQMEAVLGTEVTPALRREVGVNYGATLHVQICDCLAN